MKTCPSSSKRILMIIPYFGYWPEWFAFYLESCRWNPSIDWLFFTDCSVPETVPTNVRFVQLSFADYQRLVSERLKISFETNRPYKLCDIRPAYGVIHREYLTGYDFFGFGDIDVIYGNLRAFYTDELLDRYNTLSTHADRVSGHFCLIRNAETQVQAFRRIANWQQLMSDPEHKCVDEYCLTKILKGHRLLPSRLTQMWSWFDPVKRNNLFREEFSTVNSEWTWMDRTHNYPNQWYWYQGKLTTDCGREMMYLDFMNWKSSRYLRQWYGTEAPWETLSQLIDPELKDLSQGWCISPKGFTPLPRSVQESMQVLV